MNNRVIIHKTLLNLELEPHLFRRIAVPVRIFSIQIKKNSKHELDHFERAILSLGCERYYNPLEISEILLLNEDLVKLIIDNLITQKQFYDKKIGTTSIGKDALNQVNQFEESFNAYVFFDLNRKVFFDTYFKQAELELGGEIQGQKLRINRDSTDINDQLDVLDLKHHGKTESNDMIIRKFEKLDFLRIMDPLILSTRFIPQDKVEEAYISMIIGKDKSGWYVSSLSDGNYYDLNHGKYIRENHDKLDFTDPLLDFLAFNRKKTNYLYSKSLQFIKTQLFNQKIPDEHEFILASIHQLFASVNDEQTKKEALESHRTKSLAYFDLVEDILYHHLLNANISESLKLSLPNDNYSISSLICDLSSKLGFTLNDEVIKLFSIDKSLVVKANTIISGRTIGSLLILIILNSFETNNDLMYELAKRYPNFLSYIYNFKIRRDKSRHGFTIDTFKGITVDLELIAFLLEKAFGYKLNHDNLELLKSGVVKSDYALAEVNVQKLLGNDLFREIYKRNNELADNLVILYDQLLTKKPSYLATARSIIEELISNLIKIGMSHLDTTQLQDFFNDYDETTNFVSKLSLLGFTHQALCMNQLENNEPFNNDKKIIQLIKASMNSNWLKYNLSVKIKLLLVLFEQIPDFYKKIDFVRFPDVKVLYSVTIAIMFKDRAHHQNDEFEEKDANVIVGNLMKLIKSLQLLNLL
jgi:hypothetical protein